MFIPVNEDGMDGARIAERSPSPKASPITGVAAADLPRERLARCGVEALKDHELLAIVLGTGYKGSHVLEVAQRIIDVRAKEELLEMDLRQLSMLKGVEKAKASVLVAAFELARRALQEGLGIAPVISCPADALPLLSEIKDQRKEYFLCLYLNARNQVIHKEIISIGSLSASIVHPREVFYMAVQLHGGQHRFGAQPPFRRCVA